MDQMLIHNDGPAAGLVGAQIDCGCRVKRRRLLNVLLWCVLLYGILSLRDLPGDYSHRLCGPWGCLPPIQALAAVHGAWALVMGTAVAWLLRTRSPRMLKHTGVVLTCLGAAGLVIFAGYELSTWPLKDSSGAGTYLFRHLLCSMAMATDLPLVEITIAGVATWYAGARRYLSQ
jgi:hypothetical protein